MLLIKQFNRRFSIRKLSEFGDPRIIPLDKLQIPRGSIFHYFDFNQSTIAPPVTLHYFQELEKPAQVRHHFKLDEIEVIGKPIPVPKVELPKQLINYHRANRRFRRLSSEDIILKDQKTLLIENYTPVASLYRYSDTIMSWYDKLYNLLNLIINQIYLDATKFPRQNYYIIELGNKLPSYEKFKNTYNNRTKDKIERFNTLDLLLLLELFGWSIGDKSNGLFRNFDLPTLKRVNFILCHNNGFVSINLGLLEGLRKSKDNPTGDVNSDQISRRFYKTLVDVLTIPPDQSILEEFITPDGDKLTTIKEEPEPSVAAELDEEEIKKQVEEFDKEEFVADKDIEIKEVEVVSDSKIETVINHTDIIKKELDVLADIGKLSAKTYKKLNDNIDTFNNQPSPYDKNVSYSDYIKFNKDELKIEPKRISNSKTMLDDSWEYNTTDTINKTYNEKFYKKDLMSAVASSQRLGLIVNKHNVEPSITAANTTEIHSVSVMPVGGKTTPAYFEVPSFSEDNSWMANGIEYTYRRQRRDKPIRKVNYRTVALTTAYGKNFITRGDAVVNDLGRWITNSLITVALDPDNKLITSERLANVFDQKYTLPKHYTMIARRISEFKSGGLVWHFNYSKYEDNFDEAIRKHAAVNKLTVIATGLKSSGKTAYIGMDTNSNIYEVIGNDIKELGDVISYFNLADNSNPPKEVSLLEVMGEKIPLGFIFSFYFGLFGMLRHFNINFEIVPSNAKLKGSDLTIRLSDSKILVNCDSDKQRTIINGLDKYTKAMVNYTESDLNKEDVYLNLLNEVSKLSFRYLNELTLMRRGYVDDMHARILEEMGEPTTFIGLLERANEMLLVEQSRPEINGEDMMFVGNQRVAYAIYNAHVKAMRNYLNAPPSSRKFEITQDMIWGAINSDPSVALVQGANPLQTIKERDVVTMGGVGGRSRITMVEHTREYQETDLGIVSGDTVDNGDVGITAYLSANPNFTTVDGTTAQNTDKVKKPGDIFSFAVGLAPDLVYDDSKRQNFFNIQIGSQMATVGTGVTLYRTGVEKLVANRAGVKHAVVADQDGVVIEKTNDYIKVRYVDKSEKTYPIKRWFGTHEGKYYPHQLVSKLERTDKFKAGDVITYNAMHFEPDLIEPNKVNWKTGMLARVALIEGEETFEDSSIISQRVADLGKSEITKVKETVIGFDQNIVFIVKEKDEVDTDSILCTFGNILSDSIEAHSEQTAATLAELSQFSPKAGVKGYIDKIEVMYHGDIEDMSDSVAAIVKKYDSIRKKESKASGGKLADNGSVDGSIKISGVPLAYNRLVIKFYITHLVPLSGSDKIVFTNQLKSTTQSVMIGTNTSEDGKPLDALFGGVSVDARIVSSVYTMGGANTCALAAGSAVGDILDGKDIKF